MVQRSVASGGQFGHSPIATRSGHATTFIPLADALVPVPLPAVDPDAVAPTWATSGGPVQYVPRDGEQWRLGEPADVEWITGHTVVGKTIAAAIPPVFTAYATIVEAERSADGSVSDARRRQEDALVSVLRRHSATDVWWLAYLETGADDVVFPEVPRVSMYSHWPYVLVEAGPAQAASWRQDGQTLFWGGTLPNLMFPADRSWLVSTLWDDGWASVGGSAELIDELTRDSVLAPYAHRVPADTDATPPGYESF